MKSWIATRCAFVLMVLAAPLEASAQAPGQHQHDGFFLRFLAGFGFTGMGADLGPTDTRISGGGGAFCFALGGALTPNLILFGELLQSVAFDPKVEIGGASATAKDASAAIVGVGAGLAYTSPTTSTSRERSP